MCGITGFCDYIDRSDAGLILTKMTDVLERRGPDDFGSECLREPDSVIGLGHRRLSIIELSDLGHQPMWDKSDNLVVVYNGEIYNYKEIRKTLEQQGYNFKSNSDTEVILKSFSRWGMECVKYFIGMFAFAIYSLTERKLYLCRDRLGVKPLYYYFDYELFLFASEVKCFHQHPGFVKSVNKNTLVDYLKFGYIPDSKCIFENVRKVEPGSWLVFSIREKSFQTNFYWEISQITSSPKIIVNKDVIIEELKPLLVSSFKYRLISDVPVCIFLSGGIDSSLLTSVLAAENGANLTTVTIGFKEKKFNEAPYAKTISNILGTNHIEEYCDIDSAYKLFPLLPEVYDEPFGDSSAIPTILLSQLAGKHRKVVLSADGGDELFAGYPSYQLVNRYFKYFFKVSFQTRSNLIKKVKNISGGRHYGKLSSLYSVMLEIAASGTLNELNGAINNPFSDQEIYKLVKSITPHERTSDLIKSSDDLIYNLKNLDLGQYLINDILVKVDRATMYSSIESREPFLDHRLVEFAARLLSKYHLNKFSQKLLLKEILAGYLPKEVYTRPKQGFEVPVKAWLNDKLKDYYDYYLSESKINESGLLNYTQVEIYKELFRKNINIRGLNRKLWFILVFQLWYERWVK